MGMTRVGRRSLGSSLFETMLVVGLVGGVGGTMISSSAKLNDGKAAAALIELERMADGIKAAGGDGFSYLRSEGGERMRVDSGGYDDGAVTCVLAGKD